jgi:hypothetical protein
MGAKPSQGFSPTPFFQCFHFRPLRHLDCLSPIRSLIRSFRDAETESIFLGIRSKKFQAIEKVAIRKLFQLHALTAARAQHAARGTGTLTVAVRDGTYF